MAIPVTIISDRKGYGVTTICVATHDFRRACTAVIKHAYPKEHAVLNRVRMAIDKHNITLTASDGWTSGLAIASVWESENDLVPIPSEGVLVDLAPDQIRKILAVFRAPKDKSEEPEAIIEIEVGDNYVKIADVSGLPGIDGQALELPRMDTVESFPDVAHTISRIRHLPHAGRDTIHLSPLVISAFSAAANAYGEPISITGHAESRMLSVVVGESFLGALIPTMLSDEDKAKRELWDDSWEIRLPAPDSVPRNATKPETNQIKAAAEQLAKAGVVEFTFGGKGRER